MQRVVENRALSRAAIGGRIWKALMVVTLCTTAGAGQSQTIIHRSSNQALSPETAHPAWPIVAESGLALLGAAVSLGAGWGTAYLANSNCIKTTSENPITAPFGCGFDTAAGYVAMWAPGALLLTPWLVDVTGAGAGRYASAVLGATVGVAAGVGVGTLLLKSFNPESQITGAALWTAPVLLLNAAGAVVGYEWSVDTYTKLKHHRHSEESGGAGSELSFSVAPWITEGAQGVTAMGRF